MSLTILLILNIVAAFTLIFTFEPLSERLEVAAEGLQHKGEGSSTDDEKRMSYLEHAIPSIASDALHVRRVVQLCALLLFANAVLCWFMRRHLTKRSSEPAPGVSVL